MRIDHEQLYEAVRCAALACDPKGSLDLVTSIRLHAERRQLEVIGTDLGVWLTVVLPVVGDGDIMVAAKKLEKAIKPHSKEARRPIRVELLPPTTEVHKDNTGTGKEKTVPAPHSIFHIDGAKLKMPTAPTVVEDYPVSLTSKEWDKLASYPVAVLNEVCAHLNRAMSKDETRASLNTILFRGDEAIATDGHRMHWLATDLNHAPFLVVAKAMRMLPKLLPSKPTDDDAVEVWTVGRTGAGKKTRFEYVSLRYANWRLDYSTKSFEYPDADQVRGASGTPLFLEVQKAELLDALKRAARMVGKHSVRIEMRPETGKVALVVAEWEHEGAEVSIDLAAKYDDQRMKRPDEVNPKLSLTYLGEDLDINIEGLYFRDAVDLDGDVLRFTSADPVYPLFVEGDRRNALIMPVGQ